MEKKIKVGDWVAPRWNRNFFKIRNTSKYKIIDIRKVYDVLGEAPDPLMDVVVMINDVGEEVEISPYAVDLTNKNIKLSKYLLNN